MDTIEVLYFGALRVSGHFLHARRRSGREIGATAWEEDHLDGGLLTGDYYKADTTPDGRCVVVHKDGWTAVAFWDRSQDSRPGSNSAFLAHVDLTAEALLALARDQWPEVFSRPRFPQLQIPSDPA